MCSDIRDGVADLVQNGEKVSISSAAPILDDSQQPVGVVFLDKKIENKLLDAVKKNSGAEITIFSGNKRLATTIVKNGQRMIGTTQDNPKILQTVLTEGKKYVGKADVLGKPYMVTYAPLDDRQGKILGMAFAGNPLVSLEAAVNKNKIILTIITIIMVLLAGAVSFFMTKIYLQPIQQLSEVADKLSMGEIDVSIEINTKDEIGKLANDFKRMVAAIQEQTSIAERIAAGDLSMEAQVKSRKILSLRA